LGAQFGLPVLSIALIFVAVLFQQLMAKSRSAMDRESRFLCRAALLGLTGFLITGLFDYTYGHSLGLILLSFVVVTPLVSSKRGVDACNWRKERLLGLDLLDRMAGALLFASSLPIVVPAAAITCLLSHRSPFIAHLRIGKDGRSFWVWKLRTMWARNQAPSKEETGWVERIECDPQSDTKPENDSRVTSRFARFCRRYSIDEMPQFLHVLCGQMSLVGPRPLTRAELRQHYGARMSEVLALKPGLTGYWQTRGRNRLSYRERVAYDLELVRELCPAVYLRILLATVPQVLRGENAW
jgi:lipopolysaccharide/colanic/teichoic acid biosynthesis glycosyltransferase